VSPSIETIVRLYVRKEKRERMLTLAANPKRRADFVDALLHDTRSLEPSALTPLPESGLTVEAIVQALRPAKASELAYCITDVFDADDRETPLVDALKLVVGRARDSLVFVSTARVAYYENHEGEQYVLRGKN
jgi:hypothetical protein